jgi:hypothetical protein
MPRRRRTRAADTAARIKAERALNKSIRCAADAMTPDDDTCLDGRPPNVVDPLTGADADADHECGDDGDAPF